jgi:hypothetical protein
VKRFSERSCSNECAVAKRERGRLQNGHERGQHPSTHPFSVAKSLSWLEWRGARLLNGFTRVRILPRAPVWRVNPPGRGRRLLSARCGNACESCSQLSAKLVSADLGHWLIARLPSVAKEVRFLQSAPTCLGMILSENRAHPASSAGRAFRDHAPRSVRLVARIALFQSAGEGSKPSRSTIRPVRSVAGREPLKLATRGSIPPPASSAVSAPQRPFAGEQRLLITTASRDRHPGPLPMPARPIR